MNLFVKLNNKKAFERFYTLQSPHVRGVIFRMLCEQADIATINDIEQDVFLKIWKSISTFNSKSKIETWIYRISVNTTIDYIRKRKIQGDLFEDQISSGDQFTESIHHKDFVQNLLRQIDEKHRAILVLHYFEEKSINEISKILAINLGTVKSRLSNAKKKARLIMETKGNENEPA